MFREIKSRQARTIYSFTALVILSLGASGYADNEPLQGNIEDTEVAPSRGIIEKKIEPMPSPVMAPMKATVDQTKLQGDIKDNGLKGEAETSGSNALKSEAAKSQTPSTLQGTVDKGGSDKLKPQTPKSQSAPDVLQGSAVRDESQTDPDENDVELKVEWDKWRNKFLWAVQSGVDDSLNNSDDPNVRWDDKKGAMVNSIPLGAITWFTCQITPDRHILNAKLVHSSGYPNFDKAVMEAVSALNGSEILRYPARSKRKIVRQDAGIQTATSGERKYFKFNDVERRMVPGN